MTTSSRREHRLPIFGLALVVIISGCLGGGSLHANGAGVDSDCGDVASGSDATCRSAGQVNLTAGSSRVTMFSCTRYFEIIFVPRAIFQADLPPGVTGPDPTLEFPALETWLCPQVLVGNEVVEGFALSIFADLINNPDRREKNFTQHVYILQAYSNSPAFVRMAEGYGVKVTRIPNISVTKTSTPAGYVVYQYAVPVDQPDYAPLGTYDDLPPGTTAQARAYHFVNDESLLHFGLSFRGKFTTGNVGEIEFGPGSYWSQHAKLDRFNTFTNYYTDVTAELAFLERRP